MPTPVNCTVADWGYIAGLIDGEGTISLTKLRARREHPTWFFFEPRIRIVNTNEDMINYLVHSFGAHYGVVDNHAGFGGVRAKPLHSAYWQKQSEVKDILENTLPFLWAKDSQAKLLLEYCDIRLNRERHKAPVSEREMEIYECIKVLNTGKGGNHANSC